MSSPSAPVFRRRASSRNCRWTSGTSSVAASTSGSPSASARTSRPTTFSFTDPYFLGQNISAGVDAFKIVQKQTSYRPYDFDAIGGGVRLGLPITDRLTLNTNYRYKNQEITNSKKSTRMYFPEGTTIVSSVGYGFVYSSLDSRTSRRSEGVYVNLKQEFAGVGGDTSYLKSEGEARAYADLLPDADIVGFIKVAGGNITGLNGRGGRRPSTTSSRAARRSAASPATATAWSTRRRIPPLGGKNFWATTAEVEFPFPGISPDFGLRGAVFADAGNLSDVDIPPGGGPVDRSEHHPVVGRWVGVVVVADRRPPAPTWPMR